jgi:hypothetical protein
MKVSAVLDTSSGGLWPPNATRPGRTALDGMGDEVLRLLDLKSIQWRSALDDAGDSFIASIRSPSI